MSQDASDCGCKHEKRVLSPSGQEVDEPLITIMEGEEAVTFGCGPGGCPVNPAELPSIKSLRLERIKKNDTGAYEIVEEKHVDFAEPFGGVADRGAVMPWLRPPTRNAERFSERLKAARKMGQMTTSRKLYDAIKKFSKEEDHPGAQEQEVFYVIMLDTQLYVIGIVELARGARDRVMAPIPDVLRLPLMEGAMAFVVIHNHPSAKVTPSEADKELTKQLQSAANTCDLKLLDHLIIGAEMDNKPNYYSFAEHGVIIKRRS